MNILFKKQNYLILAFLEVSDNAPGVVTTWWLLSKRPSHPQWLSKAAARPTHDKGVSSLISYMTMSSLVTNI